MFHRPRLVILTHEPLGTNLSGPGIRVIEMGRALARNVPVTIAAPGTPPPDDCGCTMAAVRLEDHAAVRRAAETADVLLVQGPPPALYPS